MVSTNRADSSGDDSLVSFFRMPLLYNRIGGGKFLAIIFFICLTFAGLSSLISLMELPIHVLTDFGCKNNSALISVEADYFLL